MICDNQPLGWGEIEGVLLVGAVAVAVAAKRSLAGKLAAEDEASHVDVETGVVIEPASEEYGGDVKREPRDDEEMVARVSLLIRWNWLSRLVVALVGWVVGDHGGLGDQGVQLREQCVRDPGCAMLDLVVPGPEGSGAPEVPQLADVLVEQGHLLFVVVVETVLDVGEDVPVGDYCDDVVGVFLDADAENFGAHFRLLLLGLSHQMFYLGGVLGGAVVVVLGVVLRCSKQREKRYLVALEGGVIVEG
eukprot:scaffold71888_cov51-Attheya_sp.AAC.1